MRSDGYVEEEVRAVLPCQPAQIKLRDEDLCRGHRVAGLTVADSTGYRTALGREIGRREKQHGCQRPQS